MFEDIDKVIELHLSGLNNHEISDIVGIPLIDVIEIIGGIEITSREILFGSNFEQSIAIEKEVIRLYKIGYSEHDIAEKLQVDIQSVRYVIDNNCGGCSFPF